MCIKCDTKEKALELAGNMLDLAEALADAFGMIEHMKARGVALDADEQSVYDRLSPFVRGSDGAAQAQGSEPDRAALMEALKKAFPGAQIVVGSPDEIGAMIQKTVDEANGRKSN
jgi:hypothetical protein